MTEPTKAELLEKAGELGIEGRTQMTKDELQRAVDQAEQDSGGGDEDSGSEEDSGEETTGVTAVDERNYTVETAQQHKDDMGSAPGGVLDGGGVPGVA